MLSCLNGKINIIENCSGIKIDSEMLNEISFGTNVETFMQNMKEVVRLKLSNKPIELGGKKSIRKQNLEKSKNDLKQQQKLLSIVVRWFIPEEKDLEKLNICGALSYENLIITVIRNEAVIERINKSIEKSKEYYLSFEKNLDVSGYNLNKEKNNENFMFAERDMSTKIEMTED